MVTIRSLKKKSYGDEKLHKITIKGNELNGGR